MNNDSFMTKKDNIILTGFMGSGKTTIGSFLADKMGWNFIDIDSLIEIEIKSSIRDYFKAHGEASFRNIETQLLEKVLAGRNQVISTGGGIVLADKNRILMEKQGLVIWLKASPEMIYQRIKDNLSRPVLGDDPTLEKIREILEFRTPFYAKADISIETDDLSIDALSSQIIIAYSKFIES